MTSLETIQLRVDLVLEDDNVLITGSEIVILNVAAIAKAGIYPDAAFMKAALGSAFEYATKKGKKLAANTSASFSSRSFARHISEKRLDDKLIAVLRQVLSQIAIHADWEKYADHQPQLLPKFDLVSQQAVLRYGNVELRVVENYCYRQDELRAALLSLAKSYLDDEQMYRKGMRRNYLEADDPDWNLRALMTNAGFYIGADPEAAWHCLSIWCEHYLDALRHSHLAFYPAALPFYLNVQKFLWETDRCIPPEVRHPDVFEVYRAIAGQGVLLLSPLASLIGEQIRSGRVKHLFKDWVAPEFYLSAKETWVSTWPNQPHKDWLATFLALQNEIDQAFKERSYSVFMASCGCYGLPICGYVRQKYGAMTLYLGNITNAYFGIRQSSTRSFMSHKANEKMWVEGDLSRYKNLGRIDGGRYT